MRTTTNQIQVPILADLTSAPIQAINQRTAATSQRIAPIVTPAAWPPCSVMEQVLLLSWSCVQWLAAVAMEGAKTTAPIIASTMADNTNHKMVFFRMSALLPAEPEWLAVALCAA